MREISSVLRYVASRMIDVVRPRAKVKDSVAKVDWSNTEARKEIERDFRFSEGDLDQLAREATANASLEDPRKSYVAEYVTDWAIRPARVRVKVEGPIEGIAVDLAQKELVKQLYLRGANAGAFHLNFYNGLEGIAEAVPAVIKVNKAG